MMCSDELSHIWVVFLRVVCGGGRNPFAAAYVET